MPNTVDEMFERVGAFIRGEATVGSEKMARPPQWDKGNTRSAWSVGQDKTINRNGPRERNGSHRRNGIKFINKINGERNHKKPYEGERFGLTEELTFLTIPRYSLTDEPIILEGVIKGHQVRKNDTGAKNTSSKEQSRSKTKNTADSQSPKEEVNGINSKDRTRREKPNDKLEFQGKPHSSPVSEHTPASVVPHEGYDQTNGSNGQGNDASQKKKRKNKDAKKLDPTSSVRRRTTVGMVRGKTNRKRPYEQVEQWMNNNISFPSILGCQLVDSPIILEALIEGFQDRFEKLSSSSLHHSLNDKVPYGQQNHNDDEQKRNPSGVLEDRRSARTHSGKKNHPSPIQASEPEETPIREKEEI
nr:hypothetical protein [Tanacetum cinerariifolium]